MTRLRLISMLLVVMAAGCGGDLAGMAPFPCALDRSCPAGLACIGGQCQPLTAPTILSFSANPTTVDTGGAATLAWSIGGIGTLTIDQGVGPVAGSNQVVHPAASVTYTLTVTNAVGSAHATATVKVYPAGKVLVAGGGGLTQSLTSAELYDPVTGLWTATGSMSTPRDQFTLTTLRSGQVLAAGSAWNVAAAETYDPITGIWTPTGPQPDPRSNQTATLLPSGKVLVAGGINGSGILSGAVLYDPATRLWTRTGSMQTSRNGHTATLLSTGKVLVAGGNTGTAGAAVASAELYDPATGLWTPALPMTTARVTFTATALLTGKVLVAGGDAGATAELYDPATGAWTRTGSLTTGYFNPTAALLPSGKVLQTSGGLAETYDPATGTWTRTGSLVTAGRIYHSATLLASGQFLLLGGKNSIGVITPAAELYGTGGAWSAASPMREARWLQASTLLRRLP
jgi:hypothetical protein